MSDKLHTYPIDKLLKWILAEEKGGKIFGYYKELFYRPAKANPLKTIRYNQILENPLGVAAGPQTQLSQNIAVSWLFGARYIELKTVQVLDEIEVAKPCIDMMDEGYNCEWSQELKIEESLDQYIDAWIIVHLLSDMLGIEFNSIFNISVGYDLKGIKTEKVQNFLRKMLDASSEIEAKVNSLAKIYPKISEIKIPSMISNNVTLSTMHGCPPDEIEGIASHLIEDWKFHTAVKLNPTLVGEDKLHEILNEKLGYKIEVPHEAFEHDLKFDDAKKLISSLRINAEKNNVEFGLKLTNTLESLNSKRMLPKNQEMVYMSGRALHPISIAVAALLQNEFNGELDLSFSGGADAFNFADIISANLKPVTVCSDLLKPGGYSRLPQYLNELEKAVSQSGANSINEFIQSNTNEEDIQKAGLVKLNRYAKSVLNSERYKKSHAKNVNIKTGRELTELDCIHAPCVETCAITQNVPQYLFYAANNDFEKAFKSIGNENPLPNITGMVCDHLCQSKCTRMNMDNSLLIREIKRFVSEKKSNTFKANISNKTNSKVAIIGAGPSGLSAAYFLALKGYKVDVFEANNEAGGMISAAIPKFRITKELITADIENIKSLGVSFHYNQKISKEQFKQLRNDHDFVYLAIGAAKGKRLKIEGEDLPNVIDQITFLESINNDQKISLGKKVAIIGAGLSAIDAARTAKRLQKNVKDEVIVLYRRTQNEMPAGREEVEELLEEGIKIIELVAPKLISKRGKKLIITCVKMELGDEDSSGRRKPIQIDNSDFEIEFDNIITAIGQDVVLDFLPVDKLEVDSQSYETQLKNVFAGGDAVRGADSLINAMADGKKVAESITGKVNAYNVESLNGNPKIDLKEYQKKLSERVYGKSMNAIPIEKRNSFDLVNPLLDEQSIVEEASRCLYCDEICNICVSVCPNLANVSFATEPVKYEYPNFEFDKGEFRVKSKSIIEVAQKYQIINIGDFCNECGNCDTFCPTSGAPYKVKPKFTLSEASFNSEEKSYLLKGNELLYKENNSICSVSVSGEQINYSDENFNAYFDNKFNPIKIEKKNDSINFPNMRKIVEMYYYLIHLKDSIVAN